MPKRKLPSDKEFAELYEAHKLAEIAEMYGVTINTVAVMAKRLGLRKNGQLQLTDNEFKELYFKYSRKELAAMYNVHVMTIDYRAKQLGIYNDERHPKSPQHNPSKCPDKETLLNLLDKYSIEEIANMYGTAKRTIGTWSLKYGIRRNKLIAASREEFIELYKEHSIPELMKICGLSRSGIEHRVRKYGLSRKQHPIVRQREPKQHPIVRQREPKFNPSKEELAELLENYSVYEISYMCNISGRYVYDKIRQYGLQVKKRKPIKTIRSNEVL